jgi:hypothetical protein
MRNIPGLICVAAMTWLLVPSQQPLPDLFPKNEQVLHGRTVLYDWYVHEFTLGDDFIVKTADSKMPSVRIVYKPFWGFDAPAAKPEDKLDKRAFIGVGDWSFTAQVPMSAEEKGGCSSGRMTHPVVDEDEKVVQELPRYMPTPGAANESAPALGTLQCFILKRNGLRPESQPKH